jgi:hypothetical protein
MIRKLIVIVLVLTTAVSARLLPRRTCRVACLGAMAASTRPAPYGSDMTACSRHNTAPPTSRCLHILVRRCRHHKPDCEFIPWPPASPSGAFVKDATPGPGALLLPAVATVGSEALQ